MADLIQIRRDTAANWSTVNPTLAQGELGVETDTDKFKVGDGLTVWNSLNYLIDAGDYVTLTGTQTLTNKTINGASNTITGLPLSTAVTGTLPVVNGGTGATTSASALTNLGAYPATNPNGYTTNTGTVTSVGGTGTVNGISLSGTVNSSGNLTLGGTLTGVSLTSQVSGTLPVANGGTGITAFGTGVATALGQNVTGSGGAVLATSAAIATPTITGTKETKVAIAASDIDLSLGNYFTRTISGATTLTVSNTAASGSVSAFILDLTNGGSAAVTFFAGVTWAAGTPPTLTASGRDVLGFFTHDNGTTWSGFVLGLGMA